MRFKVPGLLMALACSVGVWAQDSRIHLNFGNLGARATESVDVTLDASLLQLASGFLSKDDPNEVKVKKIVSRLKGVYVRSFEFDKEGQYSIGDVEGIREQVRAPGWARILSVKSIKGKNAEVYLKKDGDQVGGLVIIDAEPKELTVVHIDGPINPEELSELGGHMGIPPLGRTRAKDSKEREAKDP